MLIFFILLIYTRWKYRKTVGYLYSPYKDLYLNIFENKFILSSNPIEIEIIENKKSNLEFEVLKIDNLYLENYKLKIYEDGIAKFYQNGKCIGSYEKVVKEYCKSKYYPQQYIFIPKSLFLNDFKEEVYDKVEFNINENIHNWISSDDFESKINDDLNDEFVDLKEISSKILRVNKKINLITKYSKKEAKKKEHLKNQCIKNPNNGLCYYEYTNGKYKPIYDEKLVEEKLKNDKKCKKLKKSLDRELCQFL